MSKSSKSSTSIRSWVVILLTGLLLVSIAFVALTFSELARNAKYEQEWIAEATRFQVASQQLAKSAGEAAAGNLEAFSELTTTHEEMSRAMAVLSSGDPGRDLPAVPPAVTDNLVRLNTTWKRISANTSSITGREELLLALAEASSSFKAIIPDLQESADAAVRQLTESGAPNQQVFGASRQLVLADRMLRRVSEILQGGSSAVSAARNLQNEIDLFQQVLNALLRGNTSLGITQVRNQQALASLGRVRTLFGRARPHLQVVLDSSSDLFEVRGAADEIFLDSSEAYDHAGDLAEQLANLSRSSAWPSLETGVLGLIAMLVIAIVLVGFVIAAERHRATVATSRNRHNQRAILKLLDELSSLADGDLTVHASVTNEMTGAIADAVNYAVERLRELVMAINDTAVSVADSAQQTRTSASSLAKAAGQQAEQIDSATESIKNMAQSFDAMAERSLESRSTAQRSVEMAHQGAEKVRESISGMNTIRDEIQKTSKRIKRLGESSQEIGDIIGLINGIAEQTNVLALNAAIQAASAGGAGKGFAVVADELQQ
ncbi:MAG: chemotaxis protein, partial [Xanthomonadales bacterium]|nr:chemotaxis protein [Xanthomonadales bacterium]